MKVVKNLGSESFSHVDFTLEPGECVLVHDGIAANLTDSTLNVAEPIGGEPAPYQPFEHENYIPITE